MKITLRSTVFAPAAVAIACLTVSAPFALAEDKATPAPQTTKAADKKQETDPSKVIIATVNGKSITEADLAMAEKEIGRDLGQLPPATKRYALTEFLVENQLMADEAEKAKLENGKDFEGRLAYWRRRALRESFFEKKLKTSVSDSAAKTFYDDQIKKVKPEEEVQARHILVKTEEKAKELAKKIADGGDFAKIATENSFDPGSKDNGGMLGYFSRGQMVPEFEKTAFSLKKGEVSEPVKSKFGWHLIKLEDRRTKPLPTFEEVKEQIKNSLVYQRQQALTEDLRKKAKVDYYDLVVLTEIKARQEREKLKEQLIKQQIEKNAAEAAAKAKAGEAPK
ncbi:MAG: peptidylprolyl isomerase [Hyphomicrobiaceae bacterium]